MTRLPRIALVGAGIVASIAWTQGVDSPRAVNGQVTWLGRPAADAVVELVPVSGDVPAPTPDTAVIDQRHLRFTPSVLGVRAGTVVEFINSDPIMHNVFSPERQGANFDLGTYPQEESRTHRFDDPGTYVILCHVHPEMAAWVIVSSSPYIAVTEEDGSFSIETLPPGDYEATVWYRRRSASVGTITVGPEGGSGVRIDVGR